MNHTSKTKLCLVALKWTILVAQKLILLLLMWPFPQPQFKSARKGEGWESRNNCKRRRVSPATNTVWGGGRNGNCCLAPTGRPAGLDTGLCLLLPKSHGKQAKQSTRWFPLRIKRWKRFQTAAEVTQGKKKKKKKGKENPTQLMHYEGGHHLGNVPDRLDGRREGQGEMQRRVVEMWISCCALVMSYSEVRMKRLRKSQRHAGAWQAN